jgi:DoxX-like protein
MALLTLILSIALGATYLVVGALKLLTPRDKLLQNKNMGWAADFPARSIKGIGLAEVLGAIGLFVPWYTGILPFLTPVAATLLAVLQALAIRVHLRRGESKVVPGNASLLVLALVVAVLRFSQLDGGTASAY